METYGIEKWGITSPSAVYRNWTPAQLTEAALRRGEGKLSETGADIVSPAAKKLAKSAKEGWADAEEEQSNEIVSKYKKSAKTIFCKHCGGKIDEDSQFCKHCGKEQ